LRLGFDLACPALKSDLWNSLAAPCPALLPSMELQPHPLLDAGELIPVPRPKLIHQYLGARFLGRASLCVRTPSEGLFPSLFTLAAGRFRPVGRATILEAILLPSIQVGPAVCEPYVHDTCRNSNRSALPILLAATCLPGPLFSRAPFRASRADPRVNRPLLRERWWLLSGSRGGALGWSGRRRPPWP